MSPRVEPAIIHGGWLSHGGSGLGSCRPGRCQFAGAAAEEPSASQPAIQIATDLIADEIAGSAGP